MDQETYMNYIKKQYRLTKLIAVMVTGIFLVVFLGAVCLVPKAAATLERADETLTKLDEITEGLAGADLPGLVKHMDELLVESGEGLEEALVKVNSMDIEKLNEAIGDLQAIVEPLARFFGR